MAKRLRRITPESQEKRLKEKRGLGIGKEYKPWLTIQDVASKGRATRVRGNKIQRQFELLSDLERDYFYMVEFSDNVVDIREQFPLLSLEETLSIANELGIKHPTDPITHHSAVMTTDFVVTIRKDNEFVNLARTIKSKDDLMKKRQMEKFEIERCYWKRRGIDWAIVTDDEINQTLALNIATMRKYYSLEDIEGFESMTRKQIDHMVETFINMICGEPKVVREVAQLFDERMMLKDGTGLAIFKHLVITKRVILNMYDKINIDVPRAIQLPSRLLKTKEGVV